MASAMPSFSITLPICVPLGVCPGVACTTDWAASIAALNFSLVDMSGFGAPSFTTDADADGAEGRRAHRRAPCRPWRSASSTGTGMTSTSAFSPAASFSRERRDDRVGELHFVAGLLFELRREQREDFLRRAAAHDLDFGG